MNRAIYYLCLLFFVIINIPLQAQTGGKIPFQGKLKTENENVDGQIPMAFSITYNNETWSESQIVNVDNGLFFVVLGNITPIPLNFFTQTDLQVNITLDGETVALPLIPTPQSRYALGLADGIILPSNFVSADANKVLSTDNNGQVYWANSPASSSETTFNGDVNVAGNTILGTDNSSVTEINGALQLNDFQTIAGGEQDGMIRFNTQENTAQIYQNGNWFNVALGGTEFTTIGQSNTSETLVLGALQLSDYQGTTPQSGMIRYKNNIVQIYQNGNWTNLTDFAGGGLTRETSANGVSVLKLGGTLLRDTEIQTRANARFSVTGTGGFFVEENSYLGYSTANTTTQIGGGLILGDYNATTPANGTVRYSQTNKMAQVFITGNWFDLVTQSLGFTANNGLSLTGNQLQLGGNITQDTDFTFNSTTMSFTGNGSVKFTNGTSVLFEDNVQFNTAQFLTIPDAQYGIKIGQDGLNDIIVRYENSSSHLLQFLSSDGAWHNLATTDMISDISTLQTNIANNSNNIAINISQITVNQSDISANSNNIANINSAIANNNSQVITNSNNIAINISQIAVNQSDISANSNNIASINSAIANNNSQVITNSNNIATNISQIAVNQSDISANSNNIASINSAIANNNSQVITNSNNIATNISQIAVNQSDISANSNNIASINSAIANNNSQVALNSFNITDLQDGYDFTGNITAPMITANFMTVDEIQTVGTQADWLSVFTDAVVEGTTYLNFVSVGTDGTQTLALNGALQFYPESVTGTDGMLAMDSDGNLLFHTAGFWEPIALNTGDDGDFLNLESDFVTVYGNQSNYGFLSVAGNISVNDLYVTQIHAPALDIPNFEANFLTVNNSLETDFLTVNNAFISGLVIGAGFSNEGGLAFETGNFYGYSGGKWNKFATVGAGGNYISQGGDTFNTAVQIGTNDDFPLIFKVNNQPAGLITNTVMRNTFLGYLAGQNTTTGFANTLIGESAGHDNTTGNSNTFIGQNTGYKNTNGSGNTFIGNNTGFDNQIGTNNVFLGQNAGANNVSGNNNLYLGRFAGQDNTGTGNIFLGYNAGLNITGESNKLRIENSSDANPLIYGDFATDFVSINGNLAIGFSTAGAPLGDGMLAFETGNFYGYSGGQWNKFATVGTKFQTAVLQGGNNFGTPMTIGTIDAQNLNLIVNNTPVMKFSTAFGTQPNLVIGNMPNPVTTEGGIFMGTDHVLGSGIDFSAISGGENNQITAGTHSVIGGGENNQVNLSNYSVIGGGLSNTITSTLQSFIGGGGSNTVSGVQSFIGAGANNTISTTQSFIGGGLNNDIQASAGNSVIVGGNDNLIDNADQAFVGAGNNNRVSSDNGVVVGGASNTVSGQYSAILGGESNQIDATHSFAGGYQANVGTGHDGSFVWSDDLGNLATSAPQQFLARASGGFQFYTEPTNHFSSAVFISAGGNMGVGVAHPKTKLHIIGTYQQPTGGLAPEHHTALLENISPTPSDEKGVLALNIHNADDGGTQNYVTFYNSGTAIGAIETSTTGGADSDLGNLLFKGGGADYAEWMYKTDKSETFNASQIVAIKNGKITKDTKNATELKVISSAPITLGNWKGKDEEKFMEKVAYLGQVPVKVLGKVQAGDLIIPSGKNDGTGIAVSENEITAEQYQQVVGTAWESSNNENLKTVNVAVGQNTPEVKISELMTKTQNQNQEIETLKVENQKLKTDFEQMQQKFETQQQQIDQLLQLLQNQQKPENQKVFDEK